MQDEYYGSNTKTEYAKTRIITNACFCVYSLLASSIIGYGLYWIIVCIYRYYNNFKTIPVIFSYILGFILLVSFGLFITSFVTNFILIIKNYQTIRFYKKNPLTDIVEIMIEYDSKLWLTAPKDTFHPMSFHLTIDGNRKHFKSAIIFTNSSSYFKFPKFKMPSVLMSKNYIKNYGIVGYDRNKDEAVIISYREVSDSN